jgi:hypothetical protein
MDELALIKKLKNLEMSWGVLDYWLKFWILLVVVGVAVELVVIWVEYSHDLHDFRRGIIHAPDRPSRWLLVFALLGAGLVAIGVAGEFFIHIKAGRVETEMRNATGFLVAIANGNAEKARRDTEAERLKRVELEAALAPRRLTPADKSRFSELNQFNDTPMAVWYSTGDAEGSIFAWEFAAMAHLHKWLVMSPASSLDFAQSGHPFGSVPAPTFGVEVASTENTRSREVAKALNKYFVSRGFDAAVSPRLTKSQNPLVIVTVGTRPLGPQGEAKLRHEEAKKQNK